MTQSPETTDSRLRTATVPRYTSYPPANHFTNAVGSMDKAAWLAALDPAEPVSLYLHVPFCRRLCHFCACRTQGTQSDRPLDEYARRLVREIELTAEQIGRRQPVTAVHFGGGTPTILRPHHLSQIDIALRAHFDLQPGADISFEVDPTEIDEARLDALAAMGMTRASIGVQDFSPEVQQAIGRMQSAELTEQVAGALRARGAKSINLDLIYGLPYQTTARLRDTLTHVQAIRPERIAMFGYAHVPQMARRQRLIPQDSLPGPSERVALFELARRLLIWDGYTPIGIDHFARPGDSLAEAAKTGALFRNFQGYTTDTATTLIGLGASALSKFPQGHVQNEPASGIWAAAVDAGRIPGAKGHALTDEDRCRAAIIDRLMCTFEADLPALCDRTGSPLSRLSDDLARVLHRYEDQVTCEAGVLRLLARDGRFARLVCAEFDAYLPHSKTQYSRAV